MPSQKDWEELVEVLGEVAETVDEQYVEEQRKGEAVDEQDNTEDSTEEKETSQTEEKDDSPYRTLTFNSKQEEKEYFDEVFKSRFERLQRKEAEKREEAEREARKKALEEQENFKGLYQEAQSELARLREKAEERDTFEEKVNTYSETLDGYAQSRISELSLPKGVTRLLEKMDPKEKLDWLSENESDFAVTERVPSGEKPDNSGTTEEDNAAREEYGRSVMRGM